jgi:hypothetical protein
MGLSVELSPKHFITMCFEHPIHIDPAVIIVDTSEYLRKMESILEDQLIFTRIENDSMIVTEDRLIRTLLRLTEKWKKDSSAMMNTRWQYWLVQEQHVFLIYLNYINRTLHYKQ